MFERAQVDMAGYQRRAVYSNDERRRLLLEIELTPGAASREDAKRVVFCMLNPSTATEARNDPTIAKCVKYARKFGGDVLVVVNIFDWRDTDPKAMKLSDEPCGPANDAAILGACAGAHLVVGAWGRDGVFCGRDIEVQHMLDDAGIQLHWLYDPGMFARRSKYDEEAAKHPLYLHSDCIPKPLSLPWEEP